MSYRYRMSIWRQRLKLSSPTTIATSISRLGSRGITKSPDDGIAIEAFRFGGQLGMPKTMALAYRLAPLFLGELETQWGAYVLVLEEVARHSLLPQKEHLRG